MSEHEHETDLSFSRVLQVRAQPPEGAAASDLLTLARERALDPAVFDDTPPVFFSGTISNSNWDSYFTRMGVSTLRNYAEDAAAGVSVLLGHNTEQAPIGRSLTGKFTGPGGNGLARVDSDFFLLDQPETQGLIRSLRAGIGTDLSVGFTGDDLRYICSLCNGDMMQWMSRDACPHILGMKYARSKEAGAEMDIARATIENGRLAEYSPVYDGSCPGAMLKKARALALEGRLTDGERNFVQVRYHADLPERSRAFPGVDLRKERAMPDNTEPMTVESGKVRLTATGRLYSPEEIQAHEGSVQAVRSALDGLKVGGKTPEEGVGTLIAEVTRLRAVETDLLACRAEGGTETPAQVVTRLKAQARDGEKYRDDLITTALDEGVRAYGQEFDREAEKADLATASTDTIKRRSKQWAVLGEKNFPGGRTTVDGEETQRAERPRSAPPRAYAA